MANAITQDWVQRTDALLAALENVVTALGLFPDGSAALPGIAFAGEPGTGLSRPAAGALSTSIQGVEVARATASRLALYSAALDQAQAQSVTAAATVNLGAATGNYVPITGTASITSFGTAQAGAQRLLRFDGAATLVQDPAKIILPGGVNITAGVGDLALVVSEGGGLWRCVEFWSAANPFLRNNGDGSAVTVKATGATSGRTAAARAAETLSAQDLGAAANGTTDDTAAVTAWAGKAAPLRLNPGSYKLSSTVAFAEGDARISAAPGAQASGSGKLDWGSLTKYIGATPVWSSETLFLTQDGRYTGYAHVVGVSSFIKATTSGPVSVAVYGNAEAAASGTSVFGANFGCLVSASGATGVACEIDSHVTAAGGVAYCLALDAIGAYPSEAAIVIQNNNSTAWFKTGISFNNANGTGTIATNGTAIKMNAGSAGTFIDASAASFTVAEMALPSFSVGATPSGLNSKLRIDGSNAGTPAVVAEGSASVISPLYKSKGDNSSHIMTVGDAGVFRAKGLTSNPDYVEVQNGSGGAIVTVDGTSPNANLVLQGRGTGSVQALGGLRVGGTGTANALDVYEAVSFTPTLVGSTTAGSHTYAFQIGRATKMGKRVLCHGFVSLSAKDAAMAGDVRIGGLPYTNANVSGNYVSVSVSKYGGLANNAVALGADFPAAFTQIRLFRQAAAATASDGTTLVAADITNTTYLAFSLSYTVD